ncbi:GAF and ANTAR domain-containing protein [Jiangella muralis]|uniref:GAF and ANTAR domain-containing protein n=1 Tax=Jiangella muralis TaxID=702383 RepID=UPI00069EB2EA|nr:GAF and ANTAR domain-containing protein [Jiangella muralis]
MTTTDRQVREAFVELADTLVDDYDVIDFLDVLAQRVVKLLNVTACGIVLVDHHATLNLVAASAEQTRLLELFQLQNSEGPCLECYQTGVAVHSADLRADDERWPRFAPAARASGYAAVHALPMRLRDKVVGAMNLFDETGGALDEEVLALAQALADVATIGILHERTVRRHEAVTEQLQAALNSRIMIEQAKGVLAERLAVSMDDAFAIMRDHARSTNRKLRDVAAAVVDGRPDPAWNHPSQSV